MHIDALICLSLHVEGIGLYVRKVIKKHDTRIKSKFLQNLYFNGEMNNKPLG